jgi:hypothetical protein
VIVRKAPCRMRRQEMRWGSPAEVSFDPAPGRLLSLFFSPSPLSQVFYPIVPHLNTGKFARSLLHARIAVLRRVTPFPTHVSRPLTHVPRTLLLNDFTTSSFHIDYRLSTINQHALFICCGAEHPCCRPGRGCQPPQPSLQLPRASRSVSPPRSKSMCRLC